MVCSGKATGRALSSDPPSSAPPSHDSPSIEGWAIVPADPQKAEPRWAGLTIPVTFSTTAGAGPLAGAASLTIDPGRSPNLAAVAVVTATARVTLGWLLRPAVRVALPG